MMGIFGKSKEDSSQDKHINDIWKWIDALNKNQATILKNQGILIKNNDYFIQKHKQQDNVIRQLVAKDKQHDAKDREIETLIQGMKNMAQAIEETEKVTTNE